MKKVRRRNKAIRDWYAIVNKKDRFIDLVKDYFNAYYYLMYKEETP